jgi:CelD/BcsL family acetyltransferase involved in cellulose biosynthesis
VKLEWNEFVGSKGCVFHLFEWRDVIEKTFGYEPVYLAAYQSGRIVGVLPSFILGGFKRKRIVSLPFSDYAGPLSTEEATTTALLNALCRYKRSESVGVEIRLLDVPKGASSLYSHAIRSTFILDTSKPFDELWRSYDKKVRNSIRKSAKEGVVVKEADDLSMLQEYYHLHLKTSRRLGSFPYPYSFFEEIWSKMHPYAKVFMAFHKGLPIGGLFCFVFNSRLHIWGNASDQEFRLAQNDLLYSFAIEWACRNSVGVVDFGSTVPDTTHHFFKSRWGGIEMPINYVSTSNVISNYAQPSIAVSIVKHLPSSVAKSISSFVYRTYY